MCLNQVDAKKHDKTRENEGESMCSNQTYY